MSISSDSQKAPPGRTLASLLPGEEATVEAVSAPRRAAIRLMEMGLVPGTLVRLVRRAPLGDPLEVRLRGYGLSIRNEDAQTVALQPPTK